MHLVVELDAPREAMVHRGAVVGCHHAAFVVCTRNARLFRGARGVRRAAEPARSALTLPRRSLSCLTSRVPRGGIGKRDRGGPGGEVQGAGAEGRPRARAAKTGSTDPSFGRRPSGYPARPTSGPNVRAHLEGAPHGAVRG